MFEAIEDVKLIFLILFLFLFIIIIFNSNPSIIMEIQFCKEQPLLLDNMWELNWDAFIYSGSFLWFLEI